jgi:hypothetical protein
MLVGNQLTNRNASMRNLDLLNIKKDTNRNLYRQISKPHTYNALKSQRLILLKDLKHDTVQ